MAAVRAKRSKGGQGSGYSINGQRREAVSRQLLNYPGKFFRIASYRYTMVIDPINTAKFIPESRNFILFKKKFVENYNWKKQCAVYFCIDKVLPPQAGDKRETRCKSGAIPVAVRPGTVNGE